MHSGYDEQGRTCPSCKNRVSPCDKSSNVMRHAPVESLHRDVITLRADRKIVSSLITWHVSNWSIYSRTQHETIEHGRSAKFNYVQSA